MRLLRLPRPLESLEGGSMTVQYEWDCETVADGDSTGFEDGEAIDHAHGASFKEVKAWAAANPCAPGFRHEIVLVRDDDAGRAWAYVSGGKLPEYFTDADGADDAKVPQRFVREVAQ